MKIAVIDPSLFSLPYDEHLCAALGRAGHEVRLYGRALRDGEAVQPEDYSFQPWFYRWAEARRRRQPRCLAVPWIKAMEHKNDMWRLYRHLKRSDVDAIHFQWTPIPLVDRFWLRRLRRIAPVVLTVHDTNPLRGRPSSRLQMLGQRGVLRAADGLIGHTQFSRQVLLEQGLPEQRIHVVPHGLLGSVPGQAPPMPDEPIRRILCFGAVKPYKGIDLVLEAFARVSEDLQGGARVVICGEPLMEIEPLREQAERLGIAESVEWDLRFVPEDEVDAVCRGAYVRLFAYRDIDASGALMQALPYGRPVIATDVGAFGEVIRNEEDGLITPAGDAGALGAAMERVLRDEAEAQRFGAAAFERCRSIASWDEIAQMTVGVYRGKGLRA